MAKLLGILTDPQKNSLLQIELAAVVDGSKPFVKATYTLEGDGPLALESSVQYRQLFMQGTCLM